MTDPVVEKFIFNVSAGKASKEDLEMKTEALKERIDNIIKRVIIKDIPIMVPILSLTHDKEELELLSKALARVAVLMPELDELQRRSSILELALDDPGWLAATFGDFDQEIDAIVIDDLK